MPQCAGWAPLLHFRYSFFLGCEYLFIHSIGMCRMQQFLAVLRSSFHFPLLCMFSCHPSPPTIFFHPLLPHHAVYFLAYLPVLLFPNSYIIPFWEYYFLPFSVHTQTNVIYLTLLSVVVSFLTLAYISLLVNILQFSFSFSYTGSKIFLYTFL